MEAGAAASTVQVFYNFTLAFSFCLLLTTTGIFLDQHYIDLLNSTLFKLTSGKLNLALVSQKTLPWKFVFFILFYFFTGLSQFCFYCLVSIIKLGYFFFSFPICLIISLCVALK